MSATEPLGGVTGGLLGSPFRMPHAMLVPSSIPGELHLSDSVVEEGASIGYQYPNGIFPGCECDSATVELDLYIGSPKWSPPEEATSVN